MGTVFSCAVTVDYELSPPQPYLSFSLLNVCFYLDTRMPSEPVFVSVSTPSPSGASHSTPTSHPDYLPFLCFPFPGLWLFSYPACLTTLKKIQISLHFPDFGSFCGLSYSESVGVQERVMLGCFRFAGRVPSFQGNCKYRPSEFSFPRTAATRRLPSAHLPHTVTYRLMRGVQRRDPVQQFCRGVGIIAYTHTDPHDGRR